MKTIKLMIPIIVEPHEHETKGTDINMNLHFFGKHYLVTSVVFVSTGAHVFFLAESGETTCVMLTHAEFKTMVEKL